MTFTLWRVEASPRESTNSMEATRLYIAGIESCDRLQSLITCEIHATSHPQPRWGGAIFPA